MNRTPLFVLGIVVVVLGIIGFSSIFTVNQAQQALVLQFGKVIRTIKKPGLNFKIPLVQNVLYFDKRVLDFDNPAEEVPTLDQKQLVVDAFSRYRIVDPLLFFQRVRNEQGMEERLRTIINTNLRNEIGAVPLSAIMTSKRAQEMEVIARQVDKEARDFGIRVLDVRIRRVDLPEENSQAIFRRMQTQREQAARKIRAQGAAEKKRIRADGDRQRRIIIAEAKRTGEILRGEGDGKAQAIYNKSYGQDPAFFDFYVSMRAYRAAFSAGTTRYIGPPTGDFFRFFGDSRGEGILGKSTLGEDTLSKSLLGKTAPVKGTPAKSVPAKSAPGTGVTGKTSE